VGVRLDGAVQARQKGMVHRSQDALFRQHPHHLQKDGVFISAGLTMVTGSPAQENMDVARSGRHTCAVLRCSGMVSAACQLVGSCM